MDLPVSLPQISCLFFFILFFFLKLHKRSRSSPPNTHKKLPPGPWKLPLIGNMHQLSGTLPHHTLTNLAKKHGPLMHLKIGEISAVVVTSPRIAKEVLKTHDMSFAGRPQCLASDIMFYKGSDLAFSPYGDYWRQMRKIFVLEVLSTKSVRSFSTIREEEVWELVSSIQSSLESPVNISQKSLALSASVTWRLSIGVKHEKQDEFMEVTREAMALLGGFDVSDLFPSLKFLHPMSRKRLQLLKTHNKANTIMEHFINERRDRRKRDAYHQTVEEDILDVLLRIQERDGLEFPITDDNIKAVIFDLFLAGIQNTAGTIDWAMSEMIKNPRVMEKATDEVRLAFKGNKRIHESDIRKEGVLSYLKLVIKETLRLHISALFIRVCREACEIEGYTIPTNSRIIVNSWAISRDPEYWHDADSFIPERFENSSLDFTGNNAEYIPFGGGRRMCPGASFSLALVELALASLLYHFNFELPNGLNPEALDMTEVFSGNSSRMNDLLVIPTPYCP